MPSDWHGVAKAGKEADVGEHGAQRDAVAEGADRRRAKRSIVRLGLRRENNVNVQWTGLLVSPQETEPQRFEYRSSRLTDATLLVCRAGTASTASV